MIKRFPVPVIFLVIAGLLLVVLVIRAISERSIMENGHLMSDVWFQVTVVDAYIGFGIFYAWVVYRERSVPARIFWFILIMSLGNIATIAFVLVQYVRLPRQSRLSQVLHREG